VATPSAIPHIYNGVLILYHGDGYWNATAMCKANGKLWADYWRSQNAQEYASELSGSMGIPIDQLVRSIVTGPNEFRGTWVHQRIALHLAQWCNPRFAVRVTGWVEELLTKGHVELPEANRQPQIRAWSGRITPAFEAHKRSIVVNCPDGAFSVLTAALGETLLTEDELLRHCLPIEHHNLPDGSMGKMYSSHRKGKPWTKQCYSAPLTLPNWRKFDGADIEVQVTVYDADERRYFDGWLHRHYFPEHLSAYLEHKFPKREFGLTSASAADNSSRRITGRRAILPPHVLRQIDSCEGRFIPANAALGRPPQQELLFNESADE
jgi:KilA-N domain